MISEAFLLRELGALRIPVNDIIEFSEVITSEKLGPVDLKYRGYTEHIHESARFIYDLLVQGINENKSVGRENDKKQVLDNILDIILQSHLIRSPLNRIIGFSEVIMRELFGPIDSRYRTCVEEMYARGCFYWA
jgi:signal transduction histidine kinase